MLGELIDLQRSLEVFADGRGAGGRAAAQRPHPVPEADRRLRPPTGSAKGAPITESQPTTGNLDLQAKKLGVLVKLNNELLRFASPSAEGLVRLDMARAAALKADLAMLEGTGGTQIKGLHHLLAASRTHTASTTGAERRHVHARRRGADGEQAAGRGGRADGVGDAEGDVRGADEPPGRRGERRPTARGRSCSATRSRRAERPAGASCTARRWCGRRRCRTRAAKGGGTDLTYILLGYFPDWIVARMGVMEFLASGLGDTALAERQTVPARHPAHRRRPAPRRPASCCATSLLVA